MNPKNIGKSAFVGDRFHVLYRDELGNYAKVKGKKVYVDSGDGR